MFLFRRKVVGEDGQELKQAHMGGGEASMFYCNEKKRWRQKRADGEESSEDEKPLAPPPMAPVKRVSAAKGTATVPQWNPHAHLLRKKAKKNEPPTNVTQFDPAGPFAGNMPTVQPIVAATNPFAPKELVATSGGAELAEAQNENMGHPASFDEKFKVPAPDYQLHEEQESSAQSEDTSPEEESSAAGMSDKSPEMVKNGMYDEYSDEQHDLGVVKPDGPVVGESEVYEENFEEPYEMARSIDDDFDDLPELIEPQVDNVHEQHDFVVKSQISGSTTETKDSGSVKADSQPNSAGTEEVRRLLEYNANILARALEAERLLALEKHKTAELEKKIQVLKEESQNTSTAVTRSELSSDTNMTLDECTELVDTLVNSSADQFVVKATCSKLDRATTFDNRESMVESGGVEAIFSVLKKYDENAEIVLPIANALRNLSFCDEAVDAVAKSEKMSVILNILDYHQDAKIAVACCGSIMNLCCSADNRKALFMSDGLACLVRTAEKHPNTSNVLENACQALYITALHGKNRVVDAGGLRVPKLMATHTSRSVKKWGKWLQEIIQ
eukprot:GEMP01020173.1.p1 GENE.GEMP01020173.1~~GEMP01020173.1.p1  ORF type:complete len:558 (-),score=150.36 GEMP01020173.1:951-2624(-)